MGTILQSYRYFMQEAYSAKNHLKKSFLPRGG